MIRGCSQNVQRCELFYHWQPPKMYFGGCHWLSGNLILIERWNCPQLNVQFINSSLQNAFFEYRVHIFVQFSKKTTYKAETPIHIMKSGTPFVCVISCLKVTFKKNTNNYVSNLIVPCFFPQIFRWKCQDHLRWRDGRRRRGGRGLHRLRVCPRGVVPVAHAPQHQVRIPF